MIYSGRVKNTVVVLLLLSMLASAQARAVHWYVDHSGGLAAEQATPMDATQPSTDEVGQSSQDAPDGSSHAGGHCDVCGHAGMPAIGAYASVITRVVLTSDRVANRVESQFADPPVQRADKPPR